MNKVYVVSTAEPDYELLAVFEDEEAAHSFAETYSAYVTEASFYR